MYFVILKYLVRFLMMIVLGLVTFAVVVLHPIITSTLHYHQNLHYQTNYYDLTKMHLKRFV